MERITHLFFFFNGRTVESASHAPPYPSVLASFFADHAPLLLHARKRSVLRKWSTRKHGMEFPLFRRERACPRRRRKTAHKKCLMLVSHAPPYPSDRSSFFGEHAPLLLHARKRSVTRERSKRKRGAFAERLTPRDGTHAGFSEPHRRVRAVSTSGGFFPERRKRGPGSIPGDSSTIFGFFVIVEL